MSSLTKGLFLATLVNLVAAVLFLTGLINIGDAPGWYVTFPLTVIFFGLFLLSWAFQREFAAFDAEQRRLHGSEVTDNRCESIEAARHDEHHAPAKA